MSFLDRIINSGNKRGNAALNILCFILLFSGFCLYIFSETMTPVKWIPLGAGLLLLLAAVIANFNYLLKKANSRSFKYSTNAVVYSIIIIAIVCVLNFIVSKQNKQWDLTQNKRYSLSEQSIKLMKGLKEDLKILMFYPELEKMAFNDLFKQYEYVSPKFKYEFIDMNKKPKLAADNQVGENRTAVIKYKDKSERLNGGFGEQELTNAIIRVTRPGKKSVYFLTGHNEADCDAMTEEGVSVVKDTLVAQNLEVKKLNLLEKQMFPADCTTLIVAGPKVELMETEEAMISKYLNDGGKVMMLLDPKPSASFEKLLKQYGIEVGTNIVIDPKPALKAMGLGDYTIPLGCIYDPEHTITKGFSVATFFPLARSVTPAPSAPVGYKLTSLVKTSPETFADTTYLTEQNIKFDADKDIKGPISLAVISAKTVYNHTTPAAGTDENALKSDPDAQKSKNREMRLVVLGTSKIIKNRFVNVQGNGNFILNIINYLVEEEDLIAIKPKNNQQAKIDMTQQDANNIWYIALVLMPGVVVLAGFTVWFSRSR